VSGAYIVDPPLRGALTSETDVLFVMTYLVKLSVAPLVLHISPLPSVGIWRTLGVNYDCPV